MNNINWTFKIILGRNIEKRLVSIDTINGILIQNAVFVLCFA